MDANTNTCPTEFLEAYIDAALFSTFDDDGRPLDENFTVENIEPETLATMRADCERFWESFGTIIDDASQAGHDFWLTRNRHGAGFWDGDYASPAAELLTAGAHVFGSFDLLTDGTSVVNS